MGRFYCPGLRQDSRQIDIIDPSEIHHLLRVLRVKPGSRFLVFNPPDLEAEVEATAVSVRAISLAVLSVTARMSSSTRLILGCAVPKKSKFEIIIEKAVELGATEIIPLLTERTIAVSAEDDRIRIKRQRYETVAFNAVKQSCQSFFPVIHPLTRFSDVLKEYVHYPIQTLIPSLQNGNLPVWNVLGGLDRKQPILILVGPEGDFTPKEYADAKLAGAIPVSLGPSVLKVETAAMSAMAVARFYLESSEPSGC